MRLGIFGGTFNPIHIGHITASLEFYDIAKLDMMLVIPDRIPPHKEGKFLSSEHRLVMTKLVYTDPDIIGARSITVSDMEIKREGKSFTYVTLTELRRKYEDAELFLYTGSDMFYTLESWFRGDAILKMCTVVTASRESGEREKLSQYAKAYAEKYGTRCIIMDYDPIVISSTEIRESLQREESKKISDFTKKLLTDSVAGYIMENGLYNE